MAGAEVEVSRPQHRRILTLLALTPGAVVPLDRLVDVVWDGAPPENAPSLVHAQISRLRALVGKDTIVQRRDGYALDVAPEAVDVARFEAAAASADYVRALAEWRGPALGDEAAAPWAQPTATRLEQLRLTVLEDHADARLARGEHAELIGELQARVDAEPLRERGWAQLMLALYRAGRQADALRAFQTARAVLAEEVGIDPSPDLVELEARILQQDPSLRAARATRSNLPAPIARFFGRDDDIAALHGWIAEGRRLVTLVGSGGIGKTALALEAARRLDDFDGDVCLVELAPTASPDGVTAAVAAALRDDASAGDGDLDDLVEMVADRSVLAIVDNCEHVVDVVAKLVEDLLGRCPGLRVLATSREPLRVSGEVVMPVEPLGVSAAAELFVDRATGRDAGAAARSPQQVHDICARLDGIPLAIELAAGQLLDNTLDQVVAKLDDRFALLTGGRRTLARHETMHAALEWSVELLDADERRLYAALSSFAGGFSSAAAAFVAPDEAGRLPALVAKSLVVPRADDRFGMLDTIRVRGGQLLDEQPDAAALRQRFRAWVQEVVGQRRDGRGASFSVLDAEADNVRSAVREDDAISVAIAPAMWEWADMRGVAREWLAIYERLERVDPDEPELLLALGHTYETLGRLDDALAMLERAQPLYAARGSTRGVAGCVNGIAILLAQQGRYDEARPYFETAAELADDPNAQAAVYGNLASLLHLVGDFAAARVAAQRAVAAAEHADDANARAYAIGTLGLAELSAGDHVAARAALGDALRGSVTNADDYLLVSVLRSWCALDGVSPEDVAFTVGAIEALSDAAGFVLPPNEEEAWRGIVAGAQAALSATAYAVEVAAGTARATEPAAILERLL
ncbi:MAG TPA: BTAD domain-containing putative transcriptional regulator [Acidimicrobiales bacterium]|nr:BTAD domain-containing putative transcriptional regulator [Acidimicrobiales bacterium]